MELQKSAPDRHNVGPQHQQLSTEKPATRQRKTNRGSAMESRGGQQKGRKKKKPTNQTIKKPLQHRRYRTKKGIDQQMRHKGIGKYRIFLNAPTGSQKPSWSKGYQEGEQIHTEKQEAL